MQAGDSDEVSSSNLAKTESRSPSEKLLEGNLGRSNKSNNLVAFYYTCLVVVFSLAFKEDPYEFLSRTDITNCALIKLATYINQHSLEFIF